MSKSRKALQTPDNDIPLAFLQRMSDLLGAEYDEFLHCLHQTATMGLRVNTLKVSPEQFRQISPYELTPVPWCKSGFTIEGGYEISPPGKHPFHAAGLFYLQEPSAMAAAEALQPQPGETVLDLAAAPGGKTTHLASLMNNSGILIANEIHPKRVWDLAENLERSGVTNAIVTNESPEGLADHFGQYFDRVLLDAPCSGEGMFRKSQTARVEWNPGLSHSCAIRQSAIMEQAARMVKPGGCLAYTTCTFSPEENENVIIKFFDSHPEFELKPMLEMDGLDPSHPEWIGLPQDHKIKLARRIWPHHTKGEGHFIALLLKTSSCGEIHTSTKSQHYYDLSRATKIAKKLLPIKFIKDFYHDHLKFKLDEKNVTIVGSYVYQLQENSPSLNGLKVIHPGLWLGSIQKDRFMPSHALAMAIHSINSQQSLNLNIDDDRVLKYLHGEAIQEPGADGWLLITVNGFPLGWGKRVQGIIKNYYPRGLRLVS